MSQQPSGAAELFWRRRAAILAGRLNFHHWLARVVPVLAALFVLVALFDLFRREIGWPAHWSLSLLLLGTAVAMAWAWIAARSHFCSANDALVRLETVHGLHNQLSAAQQGVVAWPAAHGPIDDGYASNWKQIMLPLMAGTVFLWAAHLIPVSKMKAGASADAISEPPAFAQVQSWINTLKAEDLIEPAKLQDLQSSLDKLKQRPPQDWYSQSSLEAADSLKQLTEQSMNALAQDLDKADQTVESMRDQAEKGNDANSLQAMQDKLKASADNLASGNLPLKREVTEQMKNGDAASDKALTPRQLADLHERLKKGAMAAMTASKAGGALSKEMQQAMADAANGKYMKRGEGLMIGEGEGEGKSPKGEKGGPGGKGGGTSTAPLELQERDKTTPDGPLTALTNDDMSHTALGETIKVSSSKPNVDPATYSGVQTAGTAQVTGTGGEAVWRSTYDPQEADTLSRFFK